MERQRDSLLRSDCDQPFSAFAHVPNTCTEEMRVKLSDDIRAILPILPGMT